MGGGGGWSERNETVFNYCYILIIEICDVYYYNILIIEICDVYYYNILIIEICAVYYYNILIIEICDVYYYNILIIEICAVYYYNTLMIDSLIQLYSKQQNKLMTNSRDEFCEQSVERLKIEQTNHDGSS